MRIDVLLLSGITVLSIVLGVLIGKDVSFVASLSNPIIKQCATMPHAIVVKPVSKSTSNVTLLNHVLTSLHAHVASNQSMYCLCMHHLCVPIPEQVCIVKQWSRRPHETYGMINPVVAGSSTDATLGVTIVQYVAPNMVPMRVTFEGNEGSCIAQAIKEFNQ